MSEPYHPVMLAHAAASLEAVQLASPFQDAATRRCVSTCYYALFHLVGDEVAHRIVADGAERNGRRNLLRRVLSHAGMRTAMTKIRGRTVDGSVAAFLRADNAETPAFARSFANAFLEIQGKRHDADYSLGAIFKPGDAILTYRKTAEAIAAWTAATAPQDEDFKSALCLLVLLKGQLRAEA